MGKRAVTVDALVWRLVCENGLVRLVKGRSLLYQRHIHLSKPMLHQALGNAISEALGAKHWLHGAHGAGDRRDRSQRWTKRLQPSPRIGT